MGYIIYFLTMSFLNFLIFLVCGSMWGMGSEIIAIQVMLAFDGSVMLYLIYDKIDRTMKKMNDKEE